MNRASRAFNLPNELSGLLQIAEDFGVRHGIEEQVDEAAANYAKKGEEWAKTTAKEWYDSAPWATGTFREAVEADTEDPSAPRVWVNPQKIIGRLGQTRPAIRAAYKARGKKQLKVTASGAEDYIEQVEEHAVSASTSADPITPQASREMAYGTPTPFLNTIWDEIVKKNIRRYF